MECEKHTKSGNLLEIDFYPVWPGGRRMPERSKKSKPSTKAQAKYNKNQAIKKFIRLISSNFDKTDYLLHPTYIPEYAPQSEEQARKDLINYIRRIKTKRAAVLKELQKDLKTAKQLNEERPSEYLQKNIKNLSQKIKKLKQPFRYAYSIEEQVYKTGLLQGRSNWHFHIFASGGLDDKTMEELWHKNGRINCDNYQPNKFGPEAAARYLLKDLKGKKSFSHSKNMKMPSETYRKLGSISRGNVEFMAKNRVDDREYWEKRHKGYRFIRCFPRFNEYNGNWYVSVIMYKTGDGDDLPKWNVSDWYSDEFYQNSDL